MPSIQINSPEQFAEVIPQLLADLGSRKILLLDGHLGAGKTTFVKALAKTLGITQNVVSPTFIYIRGYQNGQRTILWHLDLYRYSGDIEEILTEEMRDQADLICIEWPEIVPQVYQWPHLALHFSYVDETTRILSW